MPAAGVKAVSLIMDTLPPPPLMVILLVTLVAISKAADLKVIFSLSLPVGAMVVPPATAILVTAFRLKVPAVTVAPL